MPTEQPSNAPDQTGADARDDTAAAAVLSDGALDTTPGGGGLGGASAADPLGGSARGGEGQGPNALIDAGVRAGGSIEREAQSQSLATKPFTGGRSTRS